MTRRGFSLTLAAALPAAAQPSAVSKLTPLTLEGYGQMISAHRGRVLLVSFWATYCVPCRAELPQLVRLANQFRPRGLDLVVISADDADREAQALKFIAPLVPASAGARYIKSATDDDKYAAGIHAKWQGELPANFIYDRTGRKEGAFLGEVPTKTIQDVIEKFL